VSNDRRYEILSKKRVFDHFFKIDELHLRHTTPNGSISGELTRLIFERGDSVAAVVHNRTTNTVFFSEQFRAPTAEKGPAWLLEIPAGMIDPGEESAAAIVREVKEELGYLVPKVQAIGSFYVSPGGSSERIFLFYCPVIASDQVSAGGGNAGEGEYIARVELSVQEVFARLDADQFHDAKTLIGLQWLRIQKMELIENA
jgi:nudix-type nucleoside diphosphatase (YffH/AdpP family)